jgi:uncharacterized membrane protein HdeD (DUF308 family)
MTERAMFLSALERTDPCERAAYLDAACAGNPVLRARIEALLRSSDDAGAFLAVPAVDQLAAQTAGLPKCRGGSTMSLLAQRDPLDLCKEECLRIHRRWPLFLLLGVVLIVVGILAIISPYVTELTTLTVVMMCGILLMCAGIVEVINAFLAHQWRGFAVHMLSGIVHGVVGLLMVKHPVTMAAGITLLLAAAFMIGGTIRIVGALVHRFTDWGWVLFNGAVTLLLGILIWNQWPESSAWVIGLFVGIDLLFSGWSWVMLALLVKGVGAQGASAYPPTTGSMAPAGS